MQGGYMYTKDEIRSKIEPIAKKHNLNAVYLFGSYARGDATKESDIDLCVDITDSDIRTAFNEGGLYADFCEAFSVDVDMVTQDSIKTHHNRRRFPFFESTVNQEKEVLYARAN
jgi:predicted nucleotidyltransferase